VAVHCFLVGTSFFQLPTAYSASMGTQPSSRIISSHEVHILLLSQLDKSIGEGSTHDKHQKLTIADTASLSTMNMFFDFRYPTPNIVPMTLLLISYPIGKFLACMLPITTYQQPQFLSSAEFSLNPGPWKVKEHTLVFITNICIVLANQLTGFSLAGLCCQFLVWLMSTVWPQNLVACTLLNTFMQRTTKAMEASLLSGSFPPALVRWHTYTVISSQAFRFGHSACKWRACGNRHLHYVSMPIPWAMLCT
jgi:hypothetical protein